MSKEKTNTVHHSALTRVNSTDKAWPDSNTNLGIYDNSPRKNGITCPKCECELFDSSPMELLLSMPPQLQVHCPTCGYKGYRVP